MCTQLEEVIHREGGGTLQLPGGAVLCDLDNVGVVKCIARGIRDCAAQGG